MRVFKTLTLAKSIVYNRHCSSKC